MGDDNNTLKTAIFIIFVVVVAGIGLGVAMRSIVTRKMAGVVGALFQSIT